MTPVNISNVRRGYSLGAPFTWVRTSVRNRPGREVFNTGPGRPVNVASDRLLAHFALDGALSGPENIPIGIDPR